MTTEVLIFWLIHLFIGVIMPIAIYTGCCRVNNGQEQKEKAQVPYVSRQ